MTGSRASILHNRASAAEVAAHLRSCDSSFVPPLSERVEIGGYAQKLVAHAERFEVWCDNRLAGLVAAYCNDVERRAAFVTTVSVLPPWRGQGLGSRLLRACIQHVRQAGFERVELEVDLRNTAAVLLYRKHGFAVACVHGTIQILHRTVRRNNAMTTGRDYDREIENAADHQYAYGFDLDVMHPFMLRSFEPFFRPGKLLELGSFKGDFTRRFLQRFDDITCVEASGVAIEAARCRLGGRVKFIHSTFEAAVLPTRYENVVLTHVLEHLDDPVEVLRRINDEWLAEGGRLFLVCPNANAASRQIAVKMGLITHNAAVTAAEAQHGHRCTYALDTLEHDAVAAGLKVVHRSGIFFKALANFQWDRLLKTDIISKEYLDACYQLGQQYPDLCASIFLVCERSTLRQPPSV
jgi:GNAT superfamily N-acetyltransferase/2-polyprenyl-3-methyl-5-hydroxy-6-metoxy-1,4-benzoquinol methylase